MNMKMIHSLTSLVYTIMPVTKDIGDNLYQKALSIGQVAAIMAFVFIAFQLFFNRKDAANDHLKSVIKGIFILVLAPTIVALIFWIAQGIRI